VVLVPINVAPWLWGWPNRFLARMALVRSSVFLLGPYKGGEFSTGIDSEDDLRRVPVGYTGGIWTNEIETIGRALRSRNRAQP
jgi:glycerophosphoryl diester phosphodiesterase